MRTKQILFLILSFLFIFHTNPIFSKNLDSLSIGFGSCMHQEKESPILQTILSEKLDYLIILGDIVYADHLSAKDKIPAYEKQFNRPEWKSIKTNTKLLLTWDDHDYGINDSGAEYQEKELSRSIFLANVSPFMPKNITFGSKEKEGVFYSHWIQFRGKKIHIIVPDTRFFRSPLQRSFFSYFTGKSQYSPSFDQSRSILGTEQWLWLEKELSIPTDLLVFVSSIQVIPTEQPFEKWNNFPHERDKLIQSLQNANTKELVVLSGDRHIAEIHEYPTPNKKTIVEITSSSFNLPLPFLPLEYESQWKIGNAYKNENFGTLEIFWKNGNLEWKSSIKDLKGNSVLEYHSSNLNQSNKETTE